MKNKICIPFLVILLVIPLVHSQKYPSSYVPITGYKNDTSSREGFYKEPHSLSITVKPEHTSLGEGQFNLTGWWYSTNWRDWLNVYMDELIQSSYGTEHNINNQTTYYEGIKPSKDWELYVKQTGNTLFGESELIRLQGTVDGDTAVFEGRWKFGRQEEWPPCVYTDTDQIEDFEGTIKQEGEPYVYVIRGTMKGHQEFYKECHTREPDYWEDYYKKTYHTWEGPFAVGVNPLTVDFIDAEDYSRKVIGAAADGESKVIVRIRGLPPEVRHPSQVVVLVGMESGELLDDAWVAGDTFTQTWKAPKDFGGGNPPQGRREIYFYITIDGKGIDVPEFYLYKPPLVLIHGIWANAGTFKVMHPYLINDYFGGNELLIIVGNYPKDRHFTENIGAPKFFVDFAIKRAKEQGWTESIVVKKADIVAHSMGGILSDIYVNSDGYANNVNRIITIGTPHSGSEIANFVLHFVYGEMTEEERYEFYNRFLYKAFRLFMGSFTRGALEDLQVGSPAIENYREISSNNPVPVYAIECPHMFDRPSFPIDMIYGGYYPGMGLYFWDHYLDENTTYFEDADAPEDKWLYLYHPRKVEDGLYGGVRHYSGSDYIVSLESHRGGSNSIITVPVYDHINEANGADILTNVMDILNKEIERFDQNGFSPIDLPEPRVGVYDIPDGDEFETFGRLGQNDAGNLIITSPSNGTVFNSGDDITVKVFYDRKPYMGVYFLSQDISFGFDNSTPYEFKFAVDDEFLGPMLIVAWVVNEEGSIEEDSIEVNIVTNEIPDQINTLPSDPLYLRPDDDLILYVEGVYGNISRDITSHVVGTSYISSNTSVVTVSEDGIIVAKAPGEAIINIRKGITAELQVHVLKECDEPIDGMIIRKKMKFCPGTYYLPNGIEIDIDNVPIDCNGAIIKGGGSGYGIYLHNQRGVIIKNCAIQKYDRGIVLNHSYNTNILFDNINSNNFGVYLFESDNNTIKNNNISNNIYHGVFAENSLELSIYSNIMENNGYGGDYGYGTYIRYGSDANIENNLISNNSGTRYAYGIKIKEFSNIIIQDNTISGNKDNAIQIEFSDNITLKDNNLISNKGGIYLNTSNNNKIYHNNLIDNNVQAFDNGNNYWDNGIKEGGNYWSNYDDDIEGCNDINKDGYCDLPYSIPTKGIDNYPFKKKNAWIKDMFHINLNSGWNLISIPLNLSNSSVNYLFKNISVTIFGYKNNSWFVPKIIDHKLGYWVRINKSLNLTIEGLRINDKISINKNWNLIGHPSLNEINIDESELKSYTIFTYINDSWSGYVPNMPFKSLQTLKPGYGYWIKVK